MALIRRDPSSLSAPPFEPFYSYSVHTVGGTTLLFCAGQVGSKSGGVDESMGATAGEQLLLCYENIGKILAAAGMGWDDVVKRTSWLTEDCDFAEYRTASLEAMGAALPASTGIGINMGPGVLCEIEVIAAKKAPGPEAVIKWNPDTVVPHPAYWHVATVPSNCRLLFAAGQVGKRADGTVPESPSQQCKQAYANISTVLGDAGMEWRDVIKRTTYRTPGWEREWEMPSVAAAMGEHRSCHTGIGVDFLATPDFLVEIDMIAAKPAQAAGTAVKKWNPPGVAASPAYFHAVEVPAEAQLLCSSGLVGRCADGSLPTTTAEQAVQLFENLEAVLLDAGMGWKDCVKMTTYVVEGCDLDALRAVRAAALGTELCASTLLGVRALASPELLVEIDLVAAKMPDKSSL